jgi:hypothetical protein
MIRKIINSIKNMNSGRKGVSAIEESVTSDQVSDQVGDQVIRLLYVLGSGEIGAADLMGKLNLSHRPTFHQDIVRGYPRK